MCACVCFDLCVMTISKYVFRFSQVFGDQEVETPDSVHRSHPGSEFLRVRFNVDNNLCCFCQEPIGTQEHLFYSCNIVIEFFGTEHMIGYVQRILLLMVKFGIFMQEKDLEFLLNNILIFK